MTPTSHATPLAALGDARPAGVTAVHPASVGGAGTNDQKVIGRARAGGRVLAVPRALGADVWAGHDASRHLVATARNGWGRGRP